MALAAVVVVLAVVAGVLVVVLRDDDAKPAAGIRAADVLTERQLALVRKAVPDPKCDAAAGPAAGDPSFVALDVMRVDGTCLSVATEYLPADRVAARRAALAKDPSVVESAVAPLMTADATPLLPAVEDHRDDQWPLDILGVPKGADRVPWPDGTGAVVAVLDTGIDAAHPDLAGAVVARRDYPGQGVPDPGGHGTHVAGIIAGRSGNGGITGVAPAASLLDVPVRLKDANASAPSWFVGLSWAVNHGADAVNMSFGSAYAEYRRPGNEGALEFGAAVVEFAYNSQVVVVASGGNCGGGLTNRDSGCEARNQRQVPSAYDHVVAVGAIAPDRDLSTFSTRNDDIDLVAPGGDHTNRPPGLFTGDEVLSAKPGGGFARMQGTSQAAPHVAAAAAVGRSVRPDASADEIADALVDTAAMDGIAEDDRGKTGSGHGLLNIPAMVDRLRTGPTASAPASPSGPTAGPGASGSPGAADTAARTQAAYVHDGTLYVFDGTTSNPVRRVDPQSPPRWVAWSSDHKLLVGSDDKTLFSWAGPGSRVVEKPCDWCGNPRETPALVDDAVIADPLAGAPTADLVMRLSSDGTLTRYSARTLEELGSARAVFPDDAAGDKSLRGTVAGKLIVHASGGAHASERVWLVDPVSGQAGAFHDVSGSVLGGAAVSADGGKIALVTGYGTCGQPNGMYVLAGNDLRQIAAPTPPPGVMVDELFFNGGTLLATMASYTMSPGTPCVRIASAGLWQLTGTTWQRVDPSMTAGRPLEGRPGTFPTGWLTVRGTAGTVEPAAAIDLDKGDLGTVQGRVWATPTRTEVPIPPPR